MKTINKLHCLSKRRYIPVGLLTVLLIFSNAFGQSGASQKIDLNTATQAEIATLPLTPKQQSDILSWLEYIGPFKSIYDLRKIKSIDYDTFLKLKELVQLSPLFLAESQKRVEDNYYKVERWISDDGASENFVNNWIDMLSNPVNVNTLSFFELLNLAGLSPIDAVAVVKRQQVGNIQNRRDLRSTNNLSYYGFSNLEDFIRYDDDDVTHAFGGSFSSVIKNITLSQTPSDDASSYSEFIRLDHPLDVYYKLRLHRGTKYRLEGSYLRNMGEQTIYFSDTKIPRFKAFFEANAIDAGIVKFSKIIVGDYIASFGQGVAFETTDFFMPRKTGYAWRKRLNGISGNTSRTTQYGLKGAAVEAQTGNVIGTGFFSYNSRDAIVNDDSSFSTLITMYPRLDHGLYDSISMSITNSVKELLLGGNLKYSFIPGTYVGLTLYQSMYDRPLDLQVKETLLADNYVGKYLTQIGNSADTEIEASYQSSHTTALWSGAKSIRRVYGFEFMTVIKNITLQGEYAELDRNLKLTDRHDDPGALVLSGYIQFGNFNFLLLYRDYDLGFDNPYQRSFSNYHRFKGTIYEDIFYLKDPIIGYLYSASAQPQAERGLYYSTRYQIHKTLVLTAEHDIWTRVADNAQYNRMVFNLEYRPVFKYRFKIRQKWQHRDKTNTLSPVFYQANETRLEAIVRMSRHNQIRVLYSLGFTEFTPRSRLVTNAETGGTSYVGNAGAPSNALGVTITHNVNERIKIIGSLMTYEGFLWNFEDTDFRIFNTDTRALHGWLTVFSRLSRNISVRLKYSFDLHDPMTNIVGGSIDMGAEDSNPAIDEIYYEKFFSDFRLQFDYRF
ncbi:MAG: helix-hairpin-helix domain-containing protein [Candidatus Marinimicrobia bacterium]|nr:helix-hairpin-helix domain-containing protein [Candidatus Neomarinimicrobiota bacterium]